LVALVLRSDITLISESEKRRIAGTLTDNVALCASILTAEKIIMSMALDRPYLIHHMGRTLAEPEVKLVGPDLAWARELFRIQQTILPKEYVAEILDPEPPAPPGYLKQLFEARGVPYRPALDGIAHMVAMPPEGVEASLAASKVNRLATTAPDGVEVVALPSIVQGPAASTQGDKDKGAVPSAPTVLVGVKGSEVVKPAPKAGVGEKGNGGVSPAPKAVVGVKGSEVVKPAPKEVVGEKGNGGVSPAPKAVVGVKGSEVVKPAPKAVVGLEGKGVVAPAPTAEVGGKDKAIRVPAPKALDKGVAAPAPKAGVGVAVLQVQGGAEGCILEAPSPDGVGVGVWPAFPAKQGPDGPEPIAVSTAPDGGKVVAAQAVAAVIPAGSARTRSHRFSWEKGKEVRTLVGGNGVVIHFVAGDGEAADDFLIRNA